MHDQLITKKFWDRNNANVIIYELLGEWAVLYKCETLHNLREYVAFVYQSYRSFTRVPFWRQSFILWSTIQQILVPSNLQCYE